MVAAFMAAARNGQFDRLIEILHPDALIAADATAVAMGAPGLISGAQKVAEFYNGGAKALRPAELDGFAAAVWSLRGEVKAVIAFAVEDGLVREIEVLSGDLDRLDLHTVRGSFR